MPTPTPPNAAQTKPPAGQVVEDEEDALEGPPDEEFWEKYSSHLEFPLSTVGTILLHVLAAAFIVALFGLANRGTDRSGVPLKLVDVGGFDDFGQGSEGSGGKEDPIAEGKKNPFKDVEKELLPTPDALPQAQADIKDLLKNIDPNSDIAVANQNAAAYSLLDKALQEKMLGVQRGAGPGDGRGFDGTQGKGPGGTGSDSTRARTMRWVLRFNTKSGRDYLDQLQAMGATIVVPIPPENKRLMICTDLASGKARIASADDEARIAGFLQFNDGRRDSVDMVARELGLEFRPKAFWAFFPDNVEKDLAQKEKSYRNRSADSIDETIFTIKHNASGGYIATVYDQTAKRGR